MATHTRGQCLDATLTPTFQTLCETIISAVDDEAQRDDPQWRTLFLSAMMDTARRAVELAARSVCNVGDVAPGGPLTAVEAELVSAEMSRRLRVIGDVSDGMLRSATTAPGGHA